MEDNLVSRRSKRSTAGNRMQAALAEISIDDLMQDAEEDVDFVSKVEEEDLFESDFAETDEEMDNEDAGENALQEEERRARKVARAKAFKIPRPPVRKVAFDSPADGDSAGTPSSAVKAKPQRRVSLGQTVDAATGEILELSKRQSTREATRMNTQELQSRLKSAHSRKAMVQKRPKEAERRRTQTDLIAAALDIEEENIKSHREYLAVEEARRKKARVVKPTTVGPKLRWRSRGEDVTVTFYEPAPMAQPVYQSRPTWSSPFAQGSSTSGLMNTNPYAAPSGQPSSTPHLQASLPPQYSYSYTPHTAVSAATAIASTPKSETGVSQLPSVAATPASSSVPSATRPSTSSTPLSNITPAIPTTTPTPMPVKAQVNTTTSAAPAATLPPTSGSPSTSLVPPATPATAYNPYYPYAYYTPQPGATSQPPYQPFSPYYAYPPPVGSYAPQPRPHLQLHPPQQIARKKIEKQAKNYAEVLLNEDPKVKPEWREVMDVLFGTHADWNNVRVYYGKNRPVSRQIHTCPITGLQARYRDPRSGVPYANAGAFRILTRLLAHEYVWSPDGVVGGVFVGHEKQRGAIGVPERWGDAMGGVVGEHWRRKVTEVKTAKKEKEKGKEEKEEKQKDRDKAKQKEKDKRLGGRRSSRFAGDSGNAVENGMDVDKPDNGG